MTKCHVMWGFYSSNFHFMLMLFILYCMSTKFHNSLLVTWHNDRRKKNKKYVISDNSCLLKNSLIHMWTTPFQSTKLAQMRGKDAVKDLLGIWRTVFKHSYAVWDYFSGYRYIFKSCCSLFHTAILVPQSLNSFALIACKPWK